VHFKTTDMRTEEKNTIFCARMIRTCGQTRNYISPCGRM